MSEELKPCPFCGGEAKIGDASVYCNDCPAIVWAWPYEDIESAITTWNHRAQQPNEPLTMEQLKNMPTGAPIWVCRKDYPSSEKWNDGAWCILQESMWKKILGDFEEYFAFDGCCYTADYGKTWLAYRRPPESGETE